MSTIAYLGDTEPFSFGNAGINEIKEDLNRIIIQSPTGKVDAIFFVGDASNISQTETAISQSNAKNIPIYFVLANHEAKSDDDMSRIYSRYSRSNITLNPGPLGTNKTTYSMNVGNIHIGGISHPDRAVSKTSVLRREFIESGVKRGRIKFCNTRTRRGFGYNLWTREVNVNIFSRHAFL